MISRFIQSLASYLRSIYNKFLELNHNRKLINSKLSIFSKSIIYGLIILFAYLVFNFAIHAVVMVIAIAINSILINRLINFNYFKLNQITKDFVGPVVSLGVFTLATFLYLVVPELTILLSVFIIPVVISDFNKKSGEYENELIQLGL
jgi:hypothetical protein